MKKISLLLIVTLLFSIFSIASFAEQPIGVNVDGKSLSLDTEPTVEDGRTLVPLRGILEALGLELKWDAETKTVTAENAEHKIVLPVGSKTAIVDGKEVPLDVPAKVTDGRTMVPARFIAESAGAEVKWDASRRTVNISSSDNSRRINNNNNLNNINNSSVSISNNNIDNSVNNSNNTINNYDYSTVINNNITNNYNINGLTEDMLKQLLNKLMGTNFVDSNNPDDANVNLSESPVILPFDKQPEEIWKDGVLSYKEIISSACKLAFTLPKGLSTGKFDNKTGLNDGYVKYIEILDNYGEHLGKIPSPIEALELKKGLAVVNLDVSLFTRFKDGETYKVRVFIEKDGEMFSNPSESVPFVYEDEPDVHLKQKEVHITRINPVIETDRELFASFAESVDFLFTVSNPGKSRAEQLAWRECCYYATTDFVLRADGCEDVAVKRSDFMMGVRNSMQYAASILEPEKLVKGVTYNLVPVSQTPDAEWIVDEAATYTAK